MCGIAGYLSVSKKAGETELTSMCKAIAHRGPDADGFFYTTDKTIGLGHRRLSVIDLSSAANQPMYSHCGRYVIVFNGEIYNFKEIAQELKETLRTTSDTEVLLQAFVKWGESFVSRLNGMFAFSIYDIQEEKLYVYRDRVGIKPIYYYYEKGEFYFSSELKSFYSVKWLNKGPVSKEALKLYLHLGYIPAPHSIYENIRKFPQGHYAVVTKTDFELISYWRIEEHVESRTLDNYEEAKKRLKELLHSSVTYRMISDVPFGTFLSGGIDSSLVTAIAQQHSDKPVNTFSISFNEQKFNEGKYAKQVASHLGTYHHEMECSYERALELFDSVMSIYDEPYADSSMLPTLLVSEFARKHVTMILSGDGGDETYLGYGIYNWGNRLDNPLIKLLHKPIAILFKNLPDNRFKRASYVFNYTEYSKIKSHIFSQEAYAFTNAEIDSLITNDKGTIQITDENYSSFKRPLTPNEEQAIFDLKYYLPDDLLVKVDRASMHHALEVRVPLLDHRLVNFAVNLNPDLRKKGNITKYLLKEVLYEMVPKEIFDRPKWGFGVPIIKWLQNEWKHLIDTYLSEERLSESGFFEISEVQNLIHRFRKGEEYLYNRIWILILFQKWFDEQKKMA